MPRYCDLFSDVICALDEGRHALQNDIATSTLLFQCFMQEEETDIQCLSAIASILLNFATGKHGCRFEELYPYNQMGVYGNLKSLKASAFVHTAPFDLSTAFPCLSASLRDTEG